jgi:hypothetical protein
VKAEVAAPLENSFPTICNGPVAGACPCRSCTWSCPLAACGPAYTSPEQPCGITGHAVSAGVAVHQQRRGRADWLSVISRRAAGGEQVHTLSLRPSHSLSRAPGFAASGRRSTEGWTAVAGGEGERRGPFPRCRPAYIRASRSYERRRVAHAMQSAMPCAGRASGHLPCPALPRTERPAVNSPVACLREHRLI